MAKRKFWNKRMKHKRLKTAKSIRHYNSKGMCTGLSIKNYGEIRKHYSIIQNAQNNIDLKWLKKLSQKKDTVLAQKKLNQVNRRKLEDRKKSHKKFCSVVCKNLHIRSHYDAKTHEKKVEQFLDNLYIDSGEAPPKRIHSWTGPTRPTYNQGPVEIANIVLNKPANSNTLATAHYEGKPHAKRVEDCCVKAGSDFPRRNYEKQELTEKFCELCKIGLISPAMAISHYSGKKHTKMHLKQANKFHYDVCDIYVTSQVLNPHKGKNRKKKLNQDAGSNGNTRKIDTAEKGPMERSNKFRCDVCHIYTTSQDCLNIHLLGKKHKKKLNH